ncbi:GerAB/ArcD/ProY family transporter [Halobacillus litoralis]|uniref:GerAB/ArcD/ProY family transporter n=1 Tax=Halobacillus litoralis TaxID=45668 RepID=A0A845FCW6_9BACI|nr:GerAB/ArcD/ProY family transporter [Halobacillus litoralis]MYL71425.1 GerAB/ArcD/ProY family transporter [Halobacillus litoralis]
MKNGRLLTKLQIYLMIIQAQLGLGMLSLPNILEKQVNQDAWISVLVASVLVQMTLVIYWLLLKRFPGCSYHELTQIITGPFLGKTINIVNYAGYMIIGTYTMILLVQLVNDWLLPFTPVWAIALLIIVLSMYLVVQDYAVFARYLVVLSVVLIPVFLLIIIALFQIPLEPRNLRPVGGEGVLSIIRASEGALFAVLGFEILLFIGPYVHMKNSKLLRTFSLANATIALLYIVVVVLCIMVFSPDVLKQVREPVLYMIRSLSFKAVDRIDLLFVFIWLSPMTASIMIYLLIASKSLMGEGKSFQTTVLLSGVIIYIATIFSSYSEEALQLYGQILKYVIYTVVFFFPTMLLLLSYLLKKKKVNT